MIQSPVTQTSVPILGGYDIFVSNLGLALSFFEWNHHVLHQPHVNCVAQHKNGSRYLRLVVPKPEIAKAISFTEHCVSFRVSPSSHFGLLLSWVKWCNKKDLVYIYEQPTDKGFFFIVEKVFVTTFKVEAFGRG